MQASPQNTLAVAFHLTHHCNLRCNYCYTGEKLPIAMSRQTADAGIDFVLKEAKQHKIPRLDITFFGGEPLLEKELLLYIADRFIAEKGTITVDFKTSTNATLITSEVLQELDSRGVYISISIDGNPTVQDEQRKLAGGQGSSRLVEKAIPLLLKNNPCTNVTCVITPATAARITESVDWIYSQGFRFITTTLDYSADWTMDDMKILAKGYEQLGKWYEKKMMKQERFYLSCFDERIRTRTFEPIAKNERCHLGYRQFSIAPDGELYPCIQFVTTEKIPEFMIGHVQDGFNESCRNYITSASEKEKPECSGCQLKSRCSSWCACINYMSTGSIEKASPVVCQHERLLLPITDKVANRLWKKRSNLFIHKHYNPVYPIISHLEINS